MKSVSYSIYRRQRSPDSPVVRPPAWEPGVPVRFPVRAKGPAHTAKATLWLGPRALGGPPICARVSTEEIEIGIQNQVPVLVLVRVLVPVRTSAYLCLMLD